MIQTDKSWTPSGLCLTCSFVNQMRTLGPVTEMWSPYPSLTLLQRVTPILWLSLGFWTFASASRYSANNTPWKLECSIAFLFSILHSYNLLPIPLKVLDCGSAPVPASQDNRVKAFLSLTALCTTSPGGMGIFCDANGQRRRDLPTTVLYRGSPDSPGGIVYENSRKNLGQVVGPVGTCYDVSSGQL